MTSQRDSDTQSKETPEGQKGMAEVSDNLAQEEVRFLGLLLVLFVCCNVEILYN